MCVHVCVSASVCLCTPVYANLQKQAQVKKECEELERVIEEENQKEEEEKRR